MHHAAPRRAHIWVGQLARRLRSSSPEAARTTGGSTQLVDSATAKLFLLMEELSYRHLYRVQRAWLGNFALRSVLPMHLSEDDFASNGLRGLADFLTALLKPTSLNSAALRMAMERRTAFLMALKVVCGV